MCVFTFLSVRSCRQQSGQVAAVAAFHERFGQSHQLIMVDESFSPGDFLDACDLDALSLFDDLPDLPWSNTTLANLTHALYSVTTIMDDEMEQEEWGITDDMVDNLIERVG